MILPAYTPSTLLEDLWDFSDNSFGADGMCVFLALLVALTGRTETPLSARTVGNGVKQEAIAKSIEQLLGDTCCYVTHLTVSGLMALGGPNCKAHRCLIYSGPVSDLQLRSAIGGLIQKISLQSLDGSPTGFQRYRELDEPMSCLLVHGEDWAEPDLVSRLLTLRMNQSPGATMEQRDDILAKFTLGGVPRVDAAEVLRLQKRLDQIAWKTRVEFPPGEINTSAVRDIHDVCRLEQLLSLAAVRRLVAEEPTNPSIPIVGDGSDLDAVVRLVKAVHADDDCERLTHRETETLRLLQRFVTGVAPAGRKTGKDRIFTCYELQDYLPAPAPSIDTIARNVKALEKFGLLESAEKVNRKLAWKMSDRGIRYQRAQLAERMIGFLNPPNSANSAVVRNAPSQSPVHQAPPVGGV